MRCKTRRGKWRCDKRAIHTMKVGYTVKRTGKKEFAEMHLCNEHYNEVNGILMPN